MDFKFQCILHPLSCPNKRCVGKILATQHHNRKVFLTMIQLANSNNNTVSAIPREPKHDSTLPGYKWMHELWTGNENRFFEQFRMRKTAMSKLILLLKSEYGLKPFQRVEADESVGMFLQIIGHASTFTTVTERFQHSGQTVSAHFHEVLDAVCKLGDEIIKPDDANYVEVPNYIRQHSRAYPAFNNCVGAIDGTHITICIGEEDAVKWFNRKGVKSTNCLVAVDFNLCMTYAKVGLEGSMHDSRILFKALRDVEMPFPIPHEGKYYLADSGYPNMKGFLAPYRKMRYHLKMFRGQPVLQSKEEYFNYVHSSLCMVVERTFGIIKERFKALRHMTRFDVKTQIRIIWACFALHNFICRNDMDDLYLLGRTEGQHEENDGDDNGTTLRWEENTEEDGRAMNECRNWIRDVLQYHHGMQV